MYIRTYQSEKNLGGRKERIEYQNVINKLKSEQIRRFLNVPEAEKKTSTYNHSEFSKLVDSLHETFNYLFDNSKTIDYNKPSKCLIYGASHDIKPKVIRKRFDGFSKNSLQIDYQQVFKLYDIYSKYDHFGVASMALEYTTINEICGNMFLSIFHLTDGISFCIDLLKEETKSKSDFDKLLNEIPYLRGTIYTNTLYLSEDYKKRHS